jgi:glycosyltransferase involved in cell wall biosynthesis
MDQPKISIITASLNQGRFIERTIVSVLAQRYHRLEYLLIDGGSTDGTAAVLRRHRRHFAHLETTPDPGNTALQRGLARATGDILALVSSGDMLAPGTLDFVAWYFETHPKIDMLYSHRLLVDEMDRAVGYYILPRHSNRMMRRYPLIPTETAFFRRSLYERAGDVDPTLRAVPSFELFVRFMAIGRLVRVDRFLAAYRVFATSKTTQQMAMLGSEEIAQIRGEQQRGPRPWWEFEMWREFETWRLFQSIAWRSARFAQLGLSRPGASPGLGYTYDKVWGGTLANPREGGL